MKKLILLGTTALFLSVSAQAYADGCDTRIQDLNKKFSAEEGNGRVVVGGISNQVRELRDAALIFRQNGMEDACEEVVEGINDLIEKRREMHAANDKSMDRDTWFASEVKRLKTATPVSDRSSAYRAAEVIGADLRNSKNQDLGEIEDAVLDPNGNIKYAIIAHGGFLGLGEEQIAVPWEKLKVTSDDGDMVFVMDISEEALEKAPNFKRGEWKKIDNTEWRSLNDKYYQGMTY